MINYTIWMEIDCDTRMSLRLHVINMIIKTILFDLIQ